MRFLDLIKTETNVSKIKHIRQNLNPLFKQEEMLQSNALKRRYLLVS